MGTSDPSKGRSKDLSHLSERRLNIYELTFSSFHGLSVSTKPSWPSLIISTSKPHHLTLSFPSGRFPFWKTDLFKRRDQQITPLGLPPIKCHSRQDHAAVKTATEQASLPLGDFPAIILKQGWKDITTRHRRERPQHKRWRPK